ncbi:MAG: hypothetical protein Q9208_006736 [Pyrenodesmia sp. 3 TL-2023]
MVKQDWVGFETQNLNDLRENKPKGPPNTTLTGWAQQKFNTKWYRNQEKINKTKTERGQETYNERCHHWTKGHMIQCGVHTDKNFMPGKTCAECDAEDAARLRAKKKEAEEEKKRLAKVKDQAWYKEGEKAKKLEKKKCRQAGKN